ncbi:MAG TPA: DNA polymerase III subunit delta [Pyrinomonadaceae bacterium]|nr:DNA polymerase III subunit delta [Pyrinomonadaceae bacterium]
MKILSREDLRTRLKRREISPVYLLFGAETYLRDLAAKTIADFVFKNNEARDFNEDEFSLNQSENLTYALASAEQLPMIAPKRLIRIVDVKVSQTGNKDTLKEDFETVLTSYLKNPSETSVVIFVADELDKRRRMAKLLIENSVAVEFARLDENNLTKWAKDKLKDAGAKYDENALRHLTALVGNDVRRLTNEIEKLVTAAMPEKIISYELVESLVPNSRELTNFVLTDQLIAKNKAGSLEILKKILDDGAEPLMLLGLIAHNFRRIFMAKELIKQGVERPEVVRIMKLQPKFHEEFLKTARRTDETYLKKVFQKLSQTDLAIKTSIGGGKDGARMQIEMLVCELVK